MPVPDVGLHALSAIALEVRQESVPPPIALLRPTCSARTDDGQEAVATGGERRPQGASAPNKHGVELALWTTPEVNVGLVPRLDLDNIRSRGHAVGPEIVDHLLHKCVIARPIPVVSWVWQARGLREVGAPEIGHLDDHDAIVLTDTAEGVDRGAETCLIACGA